MHRNTTSIEGECYSWAQQKSLQRRILKDLGVFPSETWEYYFIHEAHLEYMAEDESCCAINLTNICVYGI